MIPTPDIKLSESERLSPAWRTMKAKIQAQLEKLRRHNDDPNLTAEQTATLRGHIQCLKALDALDSVPLQVARPTLAQPARFGSWSENG